MCEFLSGYVKKNGDIVCEPEYTDRHDILLAANNVKDNHSAYYYSQFCCWEYTFNACEEKTFLRKDNWNLTVDESEAPKWWSKVEDKVRAYAHARITNMTIKDDRHPVRTGGCWILMGEKAGIHKMIGGRVVTTIGNVSLNQARLENVNMQNASLVGINLHNFVIESCDLCDANMTGSKIVSATFHANRMINSNFAEVELNLTLFNDCTLLEAMFNHARLTDVSFHSTNLINANFNGVATDNINMRDCQVYNMLCKGTNLNNIGFARTNIWDARIDPGYDYLLQRGQTSQR